MKGASVEREGAPFINLGYGDCENGQHVYLCNFQGHFVGVLLVVRTAASKKHGFVNIIGKEAKWLLKENLFWRGAFVDCA